MSRNRMKLVRNAISDIIDYGKGALLSKTGNLLGNALLKGQELANKFSISPEYMTNDIVDKGLKYIANKSTSVPPGVFFQEKILPVGEKLISDIINNYNNNGGSSAYPQESYMSTPVNPPGFDQYKYGPNSDLSLNDYFKNMRTRDDEKQVYLRKIKTETDRIKKLKSEGKDILSKETMDKLEASKFKKMTTKTRNQDLFPVSKGSKKMINRPNTKMDKGTKLEPKMSRSNKGEESILKPEKKKYVRRVRKTNPNKDIIVEDNNITGMKEKKKKEKATNTYTLVL